MSGKQCQTLEERVGIFDDFRWGMNETFAAGAGKVAPYGLYEAKGRMGGASNS